MREPMPAGMKVVVVLTALAGVALVVSGLLIGVGHEPPAKGIDEAAGMMAALVFFGGWQLVGAVGLALRLRLARWLVLAMDLFVGLPWTTIFAVVSVAMLAEGEASGLKRWQALVLANVFVPALVGCGFNVYYLSFGPGQHVFARRPAVG